MDGAVSVHGYCRKHSLLDNFTDSGKRAERGIRSRVEALEHFFVLYLSFLLYRSLEKNTDGDTTYSRFYRNGLEATATQIITCVFIGIFFAWAYLKTGKRTGR